MNTITTLYTPVGGPNYEPSLYGDAYATLEEAAAEWARRRNNITGQFKNWGDGAHLGEGVGADSTAVIAVTWEGIGDDIFPTNATDTWTVADLEPYIGEAAHYYD